MNVELGGVYKTRGGIDALVYWKVLDEKSDQWFVIDDRFYTWAISSNGRISNGRGYDEPDHPLDLVEDTGKRKKLKDHWHYKWKAAPELRSAPKQKKAGGRRR